MAVGQIISRAIATGAIGADQIATGAITAADIPAGEITADKLHQTLDFSTKTFTMANVHVTQAMVTQHQSALSVTESQVSDLQSYVLPNTSPTFTNTTLTGYLAGPASFVIDPAGVGDNTGTVVIAGNLQVDGTQTTINSTTVSIDDLKLSVATDAADSAAANGAGITVGGANANITYTHATTSWDFDKPVNVTGAITATGISQFSDVNIPDNHAIRFGNSQDLQIYHDGSNSYVKDVGTGNLNLQGENLALENTSGDNYFVGVNGSFVKLYYSGSEKLATTSTGIDVTGIAVADEINLDGGGDIHSTNNTGYVGIAGGTNSNVGANALFYGGSHSSLAGVTKFRSGSATNITILSDGKVGIGKTDPGTSLHVYNSTINGVATFESGDAQGGIALRDNSTTQPVYLLAVGDEFKVQTNTAERMRIDNVGRVGIGTSAPTHKLDVAGTTKAEQYLLDAIAKDISDTAIDVFIYDTRKDSDGGAWRKRTQHTSWYNETLNTATRGARKEFPAVAVIVSEINQITIYDGDDPDMPVWMIFNQGGSWSSSANLIMPTSPDPVSISFLNGILSIAYSSGYGVGILDFISESKTTIFANNVTSYNGNVSQRNGGLGHSSASDARRIVNSATNDVAMTVLPNAPIDSATGLPVPTIAVATDGGYSIIKDDGTVVDGTNTAANHQKVEKIEFTQDNMVFYGGFDYNLQDRSRLYRVDNILLSDTVITTDTDEPQNSAELYGFTTSIPANDRTLVVDVAEGSQNVYLSDPHLAFSDNELRFANYNGLYKVARNKVLPSAGLANKITSRYNTGWMNGNIKLATLSDTDDTNVVGTNLFTNGDFSNGSTGWGTSGVWSVVSGQITTTNASLNFSQNPGIIAGRQYLVKYQITSISGTFRVELPTTQMGTYRSSTGSYEEIITASSPGNVYFYGNGSVTVDNVEIYLLESDRSVNGKGLQVFGTVTKTAVATGADLMAYSGFSASNYLQQPVNTDIQNTNPRAFVCWVKSTQQASGYQYLWTLTNDSNYHYGLAIFQGTSGDGGKLYTYDQEHGLSVSSYMVADGSWHCVFFTDDEVDKKIYVDGNLVHTVNHGYDLNSANKQTMKLRIGTYSNGGNPMNIGSLSLLRVSGNIPSPEQIKKIYEDEKHLFQENAKATLYGSSNAVTALAYDDDTELLHAGTSAGRSVFQGLRRIDNTTDAVGAAISASNGMVAED